MLRGGVVGGEAQCVALAVNVRVLLVREEGRVKEVGVVAGGGRCGGGVDQDGVVVGRVRAVGTTRAAEAVSVVVDASSPVLDGEVIARQSHSHAR